MAEDIQKTVKQLEQEANYAAVDSKKPGKPSAPTDNLNDDDIHIMPNKFLPSAPRHKEKKKKERGKNRSVLIVSIAGVIFMAVVGFGLWYIVKSSAPQPVQNQPAANQNTNTVQNTNQNQNINTPVVNNENQNTNQPVNQNENTNIPVSNTNENTGGFVDLAIDSDNDGLTAEEELLYKTNMDRADTDLDGFTDGVEIANLYDPLVPNSGLVQSGAVVEYIDATLKYRFYRPKGWLAQNLDSEQLAILPDAETGELFSILAVANDQNATLNEIKDLFGSGKTYENYSLDGNPALISTDGREVISILGDHIFVITYDLGNTSAPTFLTTFKMMLKGFDYFG